MSTGQLFIIGTSNALYKITLKDGLSERDSNKMTIAFRGNTKYTYNIQIIHTFVNE